jgi:hypothetical protein
MRLPSVLPASIILSYHCIMYTYTCCMIVGHDHVCVPNVWFTVENLVIRISQHLARSRDIPCFRYRVQYPTPELFYPTHLVGLLLGRLWCVILCCFSSVSVGGNLAVVVWRSVPVRIVSLIPSGGWLEHCFDLPRAGKTTSVPDVHNLYQGHECSIVDRVRWFVHCPKAKRRSESNGLRQKYPHAKTSRFMLC